MPTIPQLPVATTTQAQDELPVSQSGVTRAVSVAELLGGTQQLIELATGSLLGRISLGPGGPEAIQIGLGLAIAKGGVVANGADHSGFPTQGVFAQTDEAILNVGGQPIRMALPALRALFTASTNVAIGPGGSISASTDALVTSQLTSLNAGLITTEANLSALAARVPMGGYVTLNEMGQITAPTVGDVGLGTASVAAGMPVRSVTARCLDTVNLVDFGALSNGGDCSVAFNAAFSMLPASGGEIFIPAGDYRLASPLALGGKALTIRGAGRGVTKIHFQHTGIGLDFSQASPFTKVILRDFSAYAESSTGQTAAVARLTYPAQQSFGYVSAVISDVEFFSYPNGMNGTSPFPQTFSRGLILNNCWSTQVHNVSWFGPPASPGATTSAVIEINGSVDTRISGIQAYYGDTVVLQTGYCEGIYLTNPVVVGVDYLFKQTDITQWPGYAPTKLVLLGLWVANGEVNTNIGTVQMTNAAGGWFVGVDITRDGGPNTSQTFFNLINVSSLYVVGCNFVGGPSSNQDIAFSFASTFNSSNNTIGGCQFQNMATLVKITGVNGTVGLTTFGLNLGNVPVATAMLDSSIPEVGNFLTFQTPASPGIPAGIANTKDHVFAAATGAVLFRVNNVSQATNYIRHQPATVNNPPTLAFDGSDSTVNGVIQTKGGNLYVNAAGGSGGSGNLMSMLNISGAVSWLQVQNATGGNLVQLSTNLGGLSLQPRGALWFSPTGGLFVPSLPTTKPSPGSNQIWNNSGVLNIA